jgi:hypothetical protein
MSATGAFIDMAAECGGATSRDGQQDLDMGPVFSQKRSRRTVPWRAINCSTRACSFASPYLFVMAQPSRDLVLQDRTRGHRPRHFHFSPGPGSLTLNILLSFAQFEREVTGLRHTV